MGKLRPAGIRELPESTQLGRRLAPPPPAPEEEEAGVQRVVLNGTVDTPQCLLQLALHG